MVCRAHRGGQVWTEHLDTRERLDYAVSPRLGAFAEVAWNGGPLGRVRRAAARLPCVARPAGRRLPSARR
ncbi:family 20 glycosylhydrolase [Agromyces italicus]|uniref:family 20 glycosylhydrolase n=1 Tax=Agromyces italicus TaxID=279572 RepID=UPI0012F7D47C|nr:family 20 glycosylhydrolase [Agromyces italicus]